MGFVVDVDGRAVGTADLFGHDSLARHAEAGISLVREARGRGIGTAAIIELVEFGFTRLNLRRILSICRRSPRTSVPFAPTGRRASSSKGASASTRGSAARDEQHRAHGNSASEKAPPG